MRGAAVTEDRGALCGARVQEPGAERLGVHADEHVPARGDGVDPLGLLAEGQARDAPEVGLALHSAGVRGDHLRAALELEHARVGDRVDEIDVARHRQLPRRQRSAGAGVDGEDHAPGRARQAVQHELQAVGGVGVVVAVHGGEQVLALGRHDLGAPALERVAQWVAGDLDAAGDALGDEVVARPGGRCQQQVGEPVGLDPVALLGHVVAVGAQPRLDVHERDAGGDGGAGAGERGVGVAPDDHDVGVLDLDDLGQALLAELELLLARSRADAQVVARLREARRVDVRLGHRLVVVLAGVDEDLLGEIGQSRGDGRGLHDLRPSADDGQDAGSR